MKAAQARSGISRYYAEADAPSGVDAFPYRGDFAYYFVPENRGRLDHFSVIAALPNFEVGAIGEGKAHAEQNLIRGERRDIDFFETQVLAPVQHGGHHF
jgi:hypothetical protein